LIWIDSILLLFVLHVFFSCCQTNFFTVKFLNFNTSILYFVFGIIKDFIWSIFSILWSLIGNVTIYRRHWWVFLRNLSTGNAFFQLIVKHILLLSFLVEAFTAQWHIHFSSSNGNIFIRYLHLHIMFEWEGSICSTHLANCMQVLYFFYKRHQLRNLRPWLFFEITVECRYNHNFTFICARLWEFNKIIKKLSFINAYNIELFYILDINMIQMYAVDRFYHL